MDLLVEGRVPVHNELWLAEEAIWKITGAYPAMVRPREHYHTNFSDPKLRPPLHYTAYGEQNGMVIEAARVRGQTIALWDFEYVPKVRCRTMHQH